MAFAGKLDETAPFLDQLARERQEYSLPPRLHELAELLIHRALELLFPHFAAEVGGRAGDIAEEVAALQTLLTEALCLPGADCGEPDAVVAAFLAELPVDPRGVDARCGGDL